MKKDVESNSLVVGPASSAGFTEVRATDVNLISCEHIDGSMEVTAKVNYRAIPRKAVVFMEGDNLVARFEEPLRAVAPGQALVLYQDDVVVGGGTIESAS